MKQPESNPLRQELARSQQIGSHPDSDMLTAFVEGSLLVREREGVMEHLARCAQCREVLSIATHALPEPVDELQPLALPRPAHSSLRGWLPWLAAAACVLIVSSALLLREQRKPGDETHSPVNTSAPTNEIAQTPAQLPQLLPPSEPKTATAPPKASSAVVRPEPAPRHPASSTTAVVSAAPVPPAPQEQNVQAISPQADLTSSIDHAVIASRGLGTKTAAAPGSRAEGLSTSLKQNQPDQAARAKAIPPMSQVVEVQEAPTTQSGAMRASAPATSMLRKSATAGAARPRWRINDFGQLERSIGDDGWQLVPTHETSKLHVVLVSGSEVWTGGENLRLEHSPDNGATWESITLPARNGYNHALTHIRFQTQQEGIIDSDDGVSWKTTDGGKTWK